MSTTPTPTVRTRDGTTLVELLVVLAVLGVMTSVAGLAFHNMRASPTAAAAVLDRIAAARREAIATGRTVSTTVMLDGRPHAVTAYPDGRVLADSMPALDALSGRPTTRTQDDARP
jgi:prepilin-type N-terminal cleavage/methylation domain-containing protein